MIDDFAHHPTAVRETLDALRQRFSGHRIIAVFEPRSWSSRKKVFQNDYESAFESADLIIIAPVFESFKLQAGDQLSTDQLVDSLSKNGKQSENAASQAPGGFYQQKCNDSRAVLHITGSFNGFGDSQSSPH